MDKVKKPGIAGGIGQILLACMIWGYGYIVIRDSLDQIPLDSLMTVRYLQAAIGMTILVVLRKAFTARKTASRHTVSSGHTVSCCSRSTIIWGTIIGILLYAAQYFQTAALGDSETTAGQVAFITALYVVFVPLLRLPTGKKHLKKTYILAMFMAVTGLFLLSVSKGESGLNISKGCFIALLGSLLFALQILAIDKGTSSNDVFLLTAVQFWAAFAASAVIQCIHSTPWSFPVNSSSLFAILFLGLISTLLGFLLQTLGQNKLTPELSSMLLSTESVFGFVFSALLVHEEVTVSKVIGCVLMLLSTLLAQKSEK